MINYQSVEKYLIDDCITGEGKLIDYVNTKLFDNHFPIKVIDHRDEYSNSNIFELKKFSTNYHRNEEYALGSNYKLLISPLANPKYSGKFSLNLEDKIIECNYYTIIPKHKID
jgi:hypothetical protein